MNFAEIHSKFDSLKLPPTPGRCSVRQGMSFADPVCKFSLFRNSGKCYWHTEDREKYTPSVIQSHFRSATTLVEAIEEVIRAGLSLEHAWLRDADFGGTFLRSGPDLTSAYLAGADLRGASLSYANLTKAVFAFADLRGAKLSNCILKDVNFWRTRLFDTKFRNSSLESVQQLERANFRDAQSLFFPLDRMLETYPNQAEPMYRELTRYLTSRGLLEDASWSAYRASVLRHRLLRKRLSLNQIKFEKAFGMTGLIYSEPRANTYLEWAIAMWAYIKSTIFLAMTGYGEKPGRVIAASTLFIMGFAGIYCLPGSRTFGDFPSSLYFSMVTFSTLGYGDLVPLGYFRFIAGVEALTGIVMTGLFLFCLGRRTVFRS